MLGQVIEHGEGGSVLEVEALEGGNCVGVMAGTAPEAWCRGFTYRLCGFLGAGPFGQCGHNLDMEVSPFYFLEHWKDQKKDLCSSGPDLFAGEVDAFVHERLHEHLRGGGVSDGIFGRLGEDALRHGLAEQAAKLELGKSGREAQLRVRG